FAGSQQVVEVVDVAGAGCRLDTGIQRGQIGRHRTAAGTAEGADPLIIDVGPSHQIIHAAHGVLDEVARHVSAGRQGLAEAHAVLAGRSADFRGADLGIEMLETFPFAYDVDGQDDETGASEIGGEAVVADLAVHAMTGLDDDGGVGAGARGRAVQVRRHAIAGQAFVPEGLDVETIFMEDLARVRDDRARGGLELDHLREQGAYARLTGARLVLRSDGGDHDATGCRTAFGYTIG